jgi:hypothetical protein
LFFSLKKAALILPLLAPAPLPDARGPRSQLAAPCRAQTTGDQTRKQRRRKKRKKKKGKEKIKNSGAKEHTFKDQPPKKLYATLISRKKSDVAFFFPESIAQSKIPQNLIETKEGRIASWRRCRSDCQSVYFCFGYGRFGGGE